MNLDIAQIVKEFQTQGIFVKASPYGSGHVNDTFLVVCQRDGQTSQYTLQRINHSIFRDPPGVMNNILRVTDHIRAKLQKDDLPDIARRVLTIIPTCGGDGYHQDSEGNYWRLYNFIDGVRTYEVLDLPEQAYQAARTFGRFQRYLADLPDPKLHETIPDFHNTPKRLSTFLNILDRDPYNRVCQVRAEIQFVLEHASWCKQFTELAGKGRISERVTHNDTKINNVLFDTKTGEGICVIDLDTVMPGLSLYDFGDMVRTATCQAAEDELDLSKIQMNAAFFEQIARGYALETADFLTKVEKETLVFAGKLITLEQMIRFLGDYINGDIYYKIHRPGQNLDRARTQMKLIQSFQKQEEQLLELTEGIWKTFC